MVRSYVIVQTCACTRIYSLRVRKVPVRGWNLATPQRKRVPTLQIPKKHKVVCKDIIKKLTNYWLERSYLIFHRNPIVPGNRSLISIGYNYNYWMVVNFVATEGSGSKNMALTIYLIYLNSLLLFPFNLFLVPISCISSLDLSMKFTLTKIETVIFINGKVLG